MKNIKYTTTEFVEISSKVHNNKYDYCKVNYESAYVNVTIICPIHGEFEQCARNHMRGAECFECGVVKRAKTRTDKSAAKFFKKARELYGEKYSYGSFKTMYDKIEITCPKHGKFLMFPIYHIGKNSVGCRLCGCEASGVKKRTPKNEFIQRAINIHGGKYVYDKVNYISLNAEVCIICPLHGDFYQRPYDHVRGRGCSKCVHLISDGEVKWLNYLGIPDDRDHRGVAIKIGKKRFILDGYDPITKTAYEYNGDYWHGNPLKYKPEDYNKDAHKTFGELYKATQDKKNLLEANGYTVISIWESEYKNKRV